MTPTDLILLAFKKICRVSIRLSFHFSFAVHVKHLHLLKIVCGIKPIIQYDNSCHDNRGL